MSNVLHPLIQEVLDGKLPDAAVEDFIVMKDYDDGGLGERILGLLCDKTIAVVDIRRSVQEGASIFRINAVARGHRYSIRTAVKNGEYIEGQIGCKDTGYKRGLAEEDLEIVILQTLFGAQCLRGLEAVRQIAKLKPSQTVTSNMLGVNWMRPKFERVGMPSYTSEVLPVSEVYLSAQTLNAGELFRALCALNQNKVSDTPRVRVVEDRPGFTPRYVALTGQYEVASAIMLGRKSITVLLEHDQETRHGDFTQTETPIELHRFRQENSRAQEGHDQEGHDQEGDDQKGHHEEGHDQEEVVIIAPAVIDGQEKGSTHE